MRARELTDEALHWAVAKAEGLAPQVQPAQYGISARVFIEGIGALVRYRPTVEWSQAGPLIDKYRLNIVQALGAVSVSGAQANDVRTAICRAVVAVAYRDKMIEIPEELL